MLVPSVGWSSRLLVMETVTVNEEIVCKDVELDVVMVDDPKVDVDKDVELEVVEEGAAAEVPVVELVELIELVVTGSGSEFVTTR